MKYNEEFNLSFTLIKMYGRSSEYISIGKDIVIYRGHILNTKLC